MKKELINKQVMFTIAKYTKKVKRKLNQNQNPAYRKKKKKLFRFRIFINVQHK